MNNVIFTTTTSTENPHKTSAEVCYIGAYEMYHLVVVARKLVSKKAKQVE